MLVAGFMCSSAWLLYGYLLKDFYVYVSTCSRFYLHNFFN